ncbi:cardiolipin synthase ClsB [Pseudomonas asiatica]|uniref:Cardiolipin synthase B n=1 Tax=Pseudomonas asiatica TaxID=2219225 RepID=A0A9X4HUF8_9PSED|nr:MULTISPECIES: cardiolipin synthase ClsB [Pseudomonas]MEE1902053.1 cardiolipin synthase ClsB [Pseudomonas inefficax]MDD2109490.1 cardiolipin synthase ClsB [Pseudomonas asiatica]MDD2115780.1 cardiolipin synthase ClsB [Pseudomonas asiatica]MEE1908694.1 cardiolipin synthase ClsB [Pseudomonas inefficax]MEE1985250.1 cardiolipin synthase ClsB [Pseudomonas inefficax]
MNRPWVDGNSVQLLINGEQYYPRVFEAMSQAREEILLETFIIFDDKVGQQLQQVLIDAARRGVRVEVAVDGYGTADLPDSFIAAMTDAGVSFHAFDPQPRLVGMRTNLFRRLHRKIVVVDGERAFIGGINYSADHLGDFGPMAKQDYAVEVVGPVVAQVHAASKRLMSPVLQPPSAVRPLTEPAGTCTAVLVERDNKVRSTDIEAHYLQAFRSARRRIVVANAYFFPGYRLMRELRNASRRGVEVRLILQGQPDMRWVRALSRLLYNYLLRDGVAIHEYCQRPLHGKVALVDDEWATVGSSNLDPLSLSFNLEANLFIRDRAFNQQLNQHLQALAREQCKPVTLERMVRGYWWRAPLIFVCFHVIRHFPRIAGWFPAHRQHLRSVQPEAEAQVDYHEGKT